MTPLLPEAKHDWKVLVYLTGKPGKLLIFLSFQKDDICFVQTLAIRFAMLAGWQICGSDHGACDMSSVQLAMKTVSLKFDDLVDRYIPIYTVHVLNIGWIERTHATSLWLL